MTDNTFPVDIVGNSDRTQIGFHDDSGEHHSIVTAETNAVTGGIELTASRSNFNLSQIARLIGKPVSTQNLHRVSWQTNQVSDGIKTCGNYKIGYKVQRNLSAPRFVFTNRNTPGVLIETNGANDITVRFAVEINGVITPAFFNGARDIVLKPGAYAESDQVPVYCLAGEIMYVRSNVSVSTTGQTWPLSGGVVVGNDTGYPDDGAVLGTSYSDLTLLGTISPSYAWAYSPAAIVSDSTVSIHVNRIGDSIAFGEGAADSIYGGKNGWQRQLLDSIGVSHSNLCMSGERATQYATQNWSPTRRYLSRYGSHTICAYGTNDVNNAITFSATQASLLAIWQGENAAGRKVAQCTITPLTASSDSWATTAGQSDLNGYTPVINQLNAWIKTLPAPLSAYIDCRAAVESGPGVNVWKAGYTSDGVHPNVTGHAAMAADANVLDQMTAFLKT